VTAAADLYALARLARPLHQHVHRAVEAQLADTGVTVAVRAVLERLLEHGPATVPALAREAALDRQPMQRAVDLAAERGLVERRANPAHRRSPLIALTAAGDARITEIKRRELEVMREIAAELDSGAISDALAVVRRLTDEFARRAHGPDTTSREA